MSLLKHGVRQVPISSLHRVPNLVFLHRINPNPIVKFAGPILPTPPNETERRRIANLGSTIDELRRLVPDLLIKSIPKQLTSSQIVLRICPTRLHKLNSFLPTSVKGQVSYYTTFKAIQLVLTSVVLHEKVKFHIQSLKVVTEDDLQSFSPNSTKIRVRWVTCSPGCLHLSNNENNFHSTSAAKLGSHSIDKITGINGIPSAVAQLSKSWLSKEKELKLERVLSGIFIFELNAENDRIVVHTVEDIDLVEKLEEETVGSLRVC